MFNGTGEVLFLSFVEDGFPNQLFNFIPYIKSTDAMFFVQNCVCLSRLDGQTESLKGKKWLFYVLYF